MKQSIFKIKKSSLGPRLAKRNGKVFNVKLRDLKKLVDRAKTINKQLSEVKSLYKERDEITLALLPLKDRLHVYGVAIIDQFEDEHTAFKTVGISRYSLKWKA